MRRSQNTATDAKSTDSLELTRRLYRGATDVAKRLDEQKASALTISDIFTPSGEILRGKLKDYCERLIFKDPIGHARKIEELLWRKAFYDAVAAAKKLRKDNVWNEVEKALLSIHLGVGVGFYHHLILRLELEFGLDLTGIVDFAYPKRKHGLSDQIGRITPQKLQSEEVKKCVIRTIHRSLICLGDLARYKLDLEPNWDAMIATRYYKMAVTLDSTIGMPHNQLGTLAGNKNHGVDAVYHYMRCILCSESFEGAEGNLKRIITTHFFNGKEKMPSQRCAARLFVLLQKWNNDSSNIDRINEDCQNLLIDIENCLTMKKIETVKNINPNDAHSIEEYLQNFKSESVSHLTDDVVFKMMAICLMSISKLQTKQSTQIDNVIAFILSLLSQLIQVTIDSLQDAITEFSLINGEQTKNDNSVENNDTIIEPERSQINHDFTNFDDHTKNSNTKESTENFPTVNGCAKKLKNKAKKNLIIKLRRRRKRINSSDSDGSDVDGQQLGSSSEELNSDISETEEEDAFSEGHEQSDGLSDDLTDDENVKLNGSKNDKVNGYDCDTELNGIQVESKEINSIIEDKIEADTVKTEKIEKNDHNELTISQVEKQNLNVKNLFEILSKEGLLNSIKICFDWLRSNPEIIKMMSINSRTLLHRIATLINLIRINSDELLTKWDRESFLMNKEKIKEYVMIVPLPEDIDLKGLNVLQNSHENLDWKILRNFHLRKQEEILLRILKIVNFGDYLCSNDSAMMKFDVNQNFYVVVDIKENKEPVKIEKSKKFQEKEGHSEHPRGKLMRHMGKLWLKAEVRALESRLRSKLMSPYLVPDHEALAKHTPALKRLVYTKKFIVVIPSIVVSALDEMKRTSGRAREATRWLETQLQKGSRFLRAQRPQERLALPLIKGPRPKDKEAWLFFQIIECCHYLTQQTKVGLSGDTEPPVVTLLTGISLEERKLSTFSPDGLAKSAGVNLEHIESFHTKWKTSSKSHG